MLGWLLCITQAKNCPRHRLTISELLLPDILEEQTIGEGGTENYGLSRRRHFGWRYDMKGGEED
ncbi:MAG: hypothetical protein ACFFCW_49780 [Candidatus Hodarchaeota archaeon]